MNIGELLVSIGADIGDLQKKLAIAESEVGGFAGSVETANAGLLKLAGVAAAAGGAIALALGVGIKEAAEHEKRVLLLTSALQAQGQASKENIDALVGQAHALELLSSKSDEEIISAQTLLLNMGRSKEEAEKLIPVALNLSGAFGTDLVQTTESLGRALVGNVRGLRQFGVNLHDLDSTVALTAEGLIALLGNRGLGGMETEAKTLGGAMRALINQVVNLGEVVGGPLLTPLINVIKAIKDGVVAMTEFAKAHPDATRAVVVFAGVMAALLIGSAGIIAARAAVIALKGVFVEQATAMYIASAAGKVYTTTVLQATLATKLFLASLGIGILITLATVVLPLIVEHWDAIVLRMRAAAAFTAELVKTGSFSAAQAASAKVWADATAAAAKAAADAKPPVDELEESLEKLRIKYKDVAAAGKIAALQAEESANAVARASLSRAGLNEAALTAIEERRQRDTRAGLEADLQARILAGEAVLAAAVRNGRELTEQDKKVAEEVAGLKKDLNASLLADDNEIAKATVKQEKDLAAERLSNVEHQRIRELDILKATKTAEADIRTQAAQVEADQRARRLSLIKLEEETRLGMLRRLAAAEQEIGNAILAAREAQLTAQNNRAEALAIASAGRRADLVRLGFLSEKEAEDQASEEKRKNEERRIATELDLERQRLVLAERLAQSEINMANIERDSKLAILKEESDAEEANLNATAALRILDLQNSFNIARAETEARIAEMRAQFLERRRLAIEELREREVLGLVSPAERKAREDMLAESLKDFQASEKAQVDATQVRLDATKAVIESITKNTAAGVEAIEKESGLKRKVIVDEHEAVVLKANETMVAARSAALLKITALERDAAIEVQRIRDEGIKNFLTEDQLKDKTKGVQRIMDSLTDFAAGVGHAIDAALRILEDRLDAIARKAGNLPKSFSVPGASGAGTLGNLEAGPAPASFTVPLVLDGKTVASVVIKYLVGGVISAEQATP